MITRIGRATALTFRIHRFEVGFAVLILALFGAALVFYILRTGAVEIPTGCVSQADSDACHEAFTTLRKSAGGSGLLRGQVPLVLGLGVALVLGIPLVAREIETGSALLAWSLSSRRGRWLRHRLLPMLAILLVGMTLIVLLEARLLGIILPHGQALAIANLGSDGAILLASSFLCFGVAVVVGAVIGRTFPAAVLAVLVLLPVLFGAPVIQGWLADHSVTTWYEPYDAATGDFISTGGVLSTESRLFWSGDELYADLSFRAELAPPGTDIEAWTEANVERRREVIPATVYDQLRYGWIVGSTLLGLVALVLTRVAVGRRRPM